jgi:hypothetical protein
MIINFELNLELGVIKDFLDFSLKVIDSQYLEFFKKDDEGVYTGIDDFANDMYSPMEQEGIVIRAVMYELNALAEWNIQNIAWSISPKPIPSVNPHNKKSEPFLPQDYRYNNACQMIEKHFDFQLSELPNYEEFRLLRENVNAFKHRKGHRKFENYMDVSFEQLLEHVKPSRDEVYKAIENTRTLLVALRKKTNTLRTIT